MEADNIAQKMKENGEMPGLRNNRKSTTGRRGSRRDKPSRTHKKRTKSLMLLQQDLFVMTCTTVFRNIEEEGQYSVNQTIRDRFNAKELYEEALQADIPWRQWNHWVRAKVMEYLKRQEDNENGDGDDE